MPDVKEHTASYYAATTNDTARYPTLRGDCTADVCIVGGGFSGLSTAILLADRGASVVLLEAHRIGWGASGRNAATAVLSSDGRGWRARRAAAAALAGL